MFSDIYCTRCNKQDIRRVQKHHIELNKKDTAPNALAIAFGSERCWTTADVLSGQQAPLQASVCSSSDGKTMIEKTLDTHIELVINLIVAIGICHAAKDGDTDDDKQW